MKLNAQFGCRQGAQRSEYSEREYNLVNVCRRGEIIGELIWFSLDGTTNSEGQILEHDGSLSEDEVFRGSLTIIPTTGGSRTILELPHRSTAEDDTYWIYKGE